MRRVLSLNDDVTDSPQYKQWSISYKGVREQTGQVEVKEVTSVPVFVRVFVCVCVCVRVCGGSDVGD